jgi:uncharacterized protein (DUF2235 family)
MPNFIVSPPRRGGAAAALAPRSSFARAYTGAAGWRLNSSQASRLGSPARGVYLGRKKGGGMKRIVICMDGTWQTLDQDKPTNIGIIARSVAHKETIPDVRGGNAYIYQTVIYTQGVGSTMGTFPGAGFFDRLNAQVTRSVGGAFGVGLEESVLTAYLRLAFNYEEGDQIYIFGFSRGAYAARRLSGLINTAGIVSRLHTDQALKGFRLYEEKPRDGASARQIADHEAAALDFRRRYGKGARNDDGTRRALDEPPPITYLGVFDTVKQRGFSEVVATMLGSRKGLRNLRICPNVMAARHAVAIDECRIGFPSTRWEGIEESNRIARARPGAEPSRVYYDQRWFIGMHGDVGGGIGSSLSARALKWIAEGAAEQGLRFYATHGEDKSPLEEATKDADICYGAPISRTPLSESFEPMNYPFRPRRIWTQRARPTLEDAEILFDDSVIERMRSADVRPRYRPGPLKPFKIVWSPPKRKKKKEKA